MADGIDFAPLSEPKMITCHFVEGWEIELRAEIIRIVGWIFLEVTEEGAAPERRIIVRAAMPLSTARALVRDLRKQLSRGGN